MILLREQIKQINNYLNILNFMIQKTLEIIAIDEGLLIHKKEKKRAIYDASCITNGVVMASIFD